MGKPDTPKSPDGRLTTSKQNKNFFFSKLKKICKKYDQIRDNNKDIKINKLEFQTQILQGTNFSYRNGYYHESIRNKRYCENSFILTSYLNNNNNNNNNNNFSILSLLLLL